MKPDAVDADLDRWMDALAGRGDLPEGRLLGEALRRAAAAREALPVQPPSAAQQQAAAQAAGLVDRGGCSLCRALARAWAALPRARLAAGLALAGLLALLLPLPGPPPKTEPESEPAPVLRGAQGPQRLQDADPLARRERMAQQLESRGVALTRYERLGRAGLRAVLDPAQRAMLAEWLASQGLAMPADGVLEVEIEAPP